MQEVVQTYVFPCSRWLSRGEEDGELVVELLPEDTDQLEGTGEGRGEKRIHFFLLQVDK